MEGTRGLVFTVCLGTFSIALMWLSVLIAYCGNHCSKLSLTILSMYLAQYRAGTGNIPFCAQGIMIWMLRHNILITAICDSWITFPEFQNILYYRHWDIILHSSPWVYITGYWCSEILKNLGIEEPGTHAPRWISPWAILRCCCWMTNYPI